MTGLVRVAAARLKVAVFSAICVGLVRVANKGLTGWRFAEFAANRDRGDTNEWLVDEGWCTLFTPYYSMLVLFVNQ